MDSGREDGTRQGDDERGCRRGTVGAPTSRLRRRQFAAAAGVAGAGLLAGCGTLLEGDDGGTQTLRLEDFRGSGPVVQSREPPGGTSIEDMPDLAGTLTVYISVGEGGLYLQLLDLLDDIYEDFSYETNQESAGGLANQLRREAEAGSTEADVFMAVDAGALGSVAEAGISRELPEPVREAVPERLRGDEWVGTAGRARAVPYNAEELGADDVPDSIYDFPEVDAFRDSFGWAPTYSAFQAFVTAMRLERSREEARSWLEGMLDRGTETYANEFNVSNSVANGEIVAGLANHYYAFRVRDQRPDAPLELAFTSGDAGALLNVSGATALQNTDSPDLADNFLRHLVSAEAQEFFATRSFGYPTIPEVAPARDLPTIEELDPPEIDLAELADAEPTIELLRETNVLS